MSRFTKYLKETMASPNNIVSYIPKNEEEISGDNPIEEFIRKNEIELDPDSVETIIALTNKTLKDFNREKGIDGREIESIVFHGIKDGLINV